MTPSINTLKLNDSNPRTITTEQFDRLKKSLSTFTKMLEIRPIAYDEDGVIWGGNMRFRALSDLVNNGLIVDNPKYYKELTGFTLQEKREFAIRDNVDMGVWDDDILANEWSDLPLEDWGIDVSGWKSDDVEEDEAPEVLQEEPKSKLGEIYELGRHILMCGDSTKIEDVEKLMDGHKADMVFTDPPYGIKYQSNKRAQTEKFEEIENDNTILTGWIPLLEVFSTGFIFIWTTWKVLDKWNDTVKPLGSLTNLIVWYKGGGGIGDLSHTFSTDYEMAMVFGRGKEITGKRVGSVWEIRKDFSGNYEHPTQKPVGLAAIAINSTTNKGDGVLDLFGGSGSTLIACEQLDRTCYMMELDPRYCDVIRKRYAKFTSGDESEWEFQTPCII